MVASVVSEAATSSSTSLIPSELTTGDANDVIVEAGDVTSTGVEDVGGCCDIESVVSTFSVDTLAEVTAFDGDVSSARSVDDVTTVLVVLGAVIVDVAAADVCVVVVVISSATVLSVFDDVAVLIGITLAIAHIRSV